MTLIDLDNLVVPFGGDSRGYGTEGDVARVTETADGVDLNNLWADLAQALTVWNAERSAITSLLSYRTTLAAEAVPQSNSGGGFEEASEFGEPEGIGPQEFALLGSTFKDYDTAIRYTWKFLRDATAEQVRSELNGVMEMDNRLVNGRILNRLFNPEVELNNFNHNCYGLWTGTDNMIPPDHLGKEFLSTHTHYLVSGAVQIDSDDLEVGIRHIQEHGYGTSAGTQLLALVNPVEAENIASFKAGVESRTGGPKAKRDFIPSAGAPAYLTAAEIVGKVAPADYSGLTIDGSYGPLWISSSEYIPVGYVAFIATAGPNHPRNVISLREHVVPTYQGLRMLPGVGPYPLQDSFWSRSFGVGVRHRGAALVMQVKASGNYEAPLISS